MAGATAYRDIEKEIVKAEKEIRRQYGDGISATYICTTCWRYSTEHEDENVKGCKLSRKSEVKYAEDLQRQLATLQRLLHDKSRKDELARDLHALEQVSSTLKSQIQHHNENFMALGGYVKGIGKLIEELSSAVVKRENVEVEETTFISMLNEILSRAGELSYYKMLEEIRARPAGAEATVDDDAGSVLSRGDEEDPYAWDADHLSPHHDPSAPPSHPATRPHSRASFPPHSSASIVPTTHPTAPIDPPAPTHPLAPPHPPAPTIPGAPTLPTVPIDPAAPASILPAPYHPPTYPTPSVYPAPSTLPAPPLHPAPPAPHPHPPVPDKPTTSPPMLREQPGVIIIHESNGAYCGGRPDSDRVIKALKSKDAAEIKFSAGMTGLRWCQNRRDLFELLDSTCPSATMYTQIAVFSHLCKGLGCQLDEIRLRKSTFTSFEKFFAEFEKMIYPDLKSVLIREATNFKQGKRCIRTYYSDFINLLNLIDAQPSFYILHFVDNLNDPDIRTRLECRERPIYEDTMEAICQQAVRIEELKKRRNDSASGRGNGGGGNGNGRNGRRDGNGRNIHVASTVVNNRNNLPEHLSKQRHAAIKVLIELELRVCVACFGDHVPTGKLESCSTTKCLFCGVDMTQKKDGHFSTLCKKAPKDADKFKEAVQKAKK